MSQKAKWDTERNLMGAGRNTRFFIIYELQTEMGFYGY